MHPLSDNELDRLSREAAEQYDVQQNTSGWDKLEQKLNKHLPAAEKKERRRFLFFIWIFALLSGGGLLWILTSDRTSQTLILKEGSSNVSHIPTEKTGVDQSPVDKSAKQPGDDHTNGNINDRELAVGEQEKSTTEKRTSALPEKSGIEYDPSASINKTSLKTKRTGLNKDLAVGQNPVNRKYGNTRPGGRPNNQATVEVTPGEGPGKEENSVERSNNETGRTSPLHEKNIQKENLPTAPVPPTTNEQKDGTAVTGSTPQAVTETVTTVADSGSTVKKASIPKNKSGFDKGLVVGAVAAPDMSNVKFSNTDKVGYNVGIQLNYRMSQRWSVNTGVLYTKKNYTSKGKDFNPPKGSWIDNVNLDMVEGSCEMFDIPVNVRYDLSKGNKHRYFLSTGLSTYLMKQEEYHYYYQYTNGNPGYRARSYPSDEHHWLSILNVSAGFEKKLSKRLSIQGEPYLKIPLAGVGYGNLKLNSYGVYFSIRYNTGLLSGRK